MSDLIDGNEGSGDEAAGGQGKHGAARALVEAALRAREEGDPDRADTLMDEATRADPQAVEDLLMELEPAAPGPTDRADAGTASDAEVAAITRTIQPHADAPNRAGITGSGSGADDM